MRTLTTSLLVERGRGLDRDAGAVAQQCAERIGHQKASKFAFRPKVTRPRARPLSAARLSRARLTSFTERVLEEDLAVGRQRHALGVALEQRVAEVRLEVAGCCG